MINLSLHLSLVQPMSYLLIAIMPNKTLCVFRKAAHLLCRRFTGHFFALISQFDFFLTEKFSYNSCKAKNTPKIFCFLMSPWV